ncbi:DUF805 domain-containing protein [Ursidibacter sp. B-7004-1]
MNWFLYVLRNSFVYQGRARRAEIAWFTFILMLINIFLSLVQAFAETLNLNNLGQGIYWFNVILTYLCCIPQLSVTARRLHDLGWSGWWQMITIIPRILLDIYCYFMLGTLAPNEVAMLMDKNTSLMVFSTGFMIFSWVFLLILIFKDGEKFENKYGISPKYQPEKIENVEA